VSKGGSLRFFVGRGFKGIDLEVLAVSGSVLPEVNRKLCQRK
jgi:hypothetical protein